MECPNDINGMIDCAKVADLAILLIDGSYGFEMVRHHSRLVFSSFLFKKLDLSLVLIVNCLLICLIRRKPLSS